VDGFWGFCGAVHPRPCRYVVVLRDPLVRARVAYEAYCRAHVSSNLGASAAPPGGYVAFAQRWSNHYTRLFAHSGSGSSGRSRDAKRSSLNSGDGGSNSIGNSGGNVNNVTFATYQQALRHLRAHGVIVIFAHTSLPLVTPEAADSSLVNHSSGNRTTHSQSQGGVVNTNTAAEDRASVWAQLSEALGDNEGFMQQLALSHDSKGVDVSSSSSSTFDHSVWCGIDVAAITAADAAADASAAATSKALPPQATAAEKHTQALCGVSLAERRAVRRLNRFDLKLVEQLRSDAAAAPSRGESATTTTTSTTTSATKTATASGVAENIVAPLTSITADSSSTGSSTSGIASSTLSDTPSKTASEPKVPATVLPMRLNQPMSEKRRNAPTLLHWWLMYAQGHGSASSANSLSVFLTGCALTIILAGFALALLNALVQRCSARFVRRCNTNCGFGYCCCRRCFGRRMGDKDAQLKNGSNGKENESHSGSGGSATESDTKRRASAAKAAAFFADGAQGSAWMDIREGSSSSSPLMPSFKGRGDGGMAKGNTGDPLKRFLENAKLLGHEAAMRAAGYAEPLDLATATDEDLGGGSFDEPAGDGSMGSHLKLKPAELKRLRRALVKEGFDVSSYAEGGVSVDNDNRSRGGVHSKNMNTYDGSSNRSEFEVSISKNQASNNSRTNGKNGIISAELAYLKDREQFAAGSGWSSENTIEDELPSIVGLSAPWSGDAAWTGSISSRSTHDSSWASKVNEDVANHYGSAATGLRGRSIPRGISSFADHNNSKSNHHQGNTQLNSSFNVGIETADPTSLPLHSVTGDPGLDEWISGSTGTNSSNSNYRRSSAADGAKSIERRGGDVSNAAAFHSTPMFSASGDLASNTSNTRGNLRPFAPASPPSDPAPRRSSPSPSATYSNQAPPESNRHVRWNEEVHVRSIPHRSEDH